MAEIVQGPGWWQGTDGRWYPPKPPPKKLSQRVWFGILIVLLGGLLLIVGTGGQVCVTGFCVGRVPATTMAPSSTVVYTVTGSGYSTVIGTANISYSGPSSGYISGAALPWTETFVNEAVPGWSVTADLTNGNSGTSVACTIKVNGKTVMSHTSTGQNTPNEVGCNGYL